MTSQTTIPVGIYWKPGVWDLARSAYVADLDTDADSPGSFVGWLARALESHARRSPQQRAELAAAFDQHPAQVSTRKRFNQKHMLTAPTLEVVDGAVAEDRLCGRRIERSAFAQEAVIAAANEASRRLGRDLPPPPAKLSNRPPRRRSSAAGEARDAAEVSSADVVPVGLYWSPAVWDLARSAYLVDRATEADPPRSFARWLGRALERHTNRSPQQRADLAAAAEASLALDSIRKSFHKKHDLPASTIEAVEDALVADRQELGRMLARSAFAREAVIVAAEEARRGSGRELPPPEELSNRPTRRRPAR